MQIRPSLFGRYISASLYVYVFALGYKIVIKYGYLDPGHLSEYIRVIVSRHIEVSP